MTRGTVWVLLSVLLAFVCVSWLGESLRAAEEPATVSTGASFAAQGPTSIRVDLQPTGVDAAYPVAYDGTSELLYAAVDNEILIFGTDGQSEGSISMSSALGKLAASGDGQYLYVSLPDSSEITRYNVAAQGFDLRWTVSALQGSPCDRVIADDMVVPGGRPEQVVVTLVDFCQSPFGTVVYQDGQALPQWVPPIYNQGLRKLEPGGEPDLLYGAGTDLNGEMLATLALSSEGITTTLSANRVIGNDFRYDRGWLFGDIGVAIEAASLSQQGKYGDFFDGAAVAPDPARNEVYYVVRRYDDDVYQWRLYFLIFERETFRLLAEALIPFDYDRTLYTEPHELLQIDADTFFLVGDTGLHRLTVSRFDQYALVPLVNSTFCGDVLDDFSNRDLGWPVGAQPGGSTAYVGAEYSLRPDGEATLEVRSPFCKRTEYEVAVDMRWVGTPGAVYGIRLPLRDSEPQEAAYYVRINSAVQGWKIDRYDPASWEDWLYEDAYWDLEPAIRPGNGTNRLRIVYGGSVYGFIYINEVMVSPVSFDAYPNLTTASLFAYSVDPELEVDARFDNFMTRNHLLPAQWLRSPDITLVTALPRR